MAAINAITLAAARFLSRPPLLWPSRPLQRAILSFASLNVFKQRLERRTWQGGDNAAEAVQNIALEKLPDISREVLRASRSCMAAIRSKCFYPLLLTRCSATRRNKHAIFFGAAFENLQNAQRPASYSPPMRAPFSATERFISRTSGTSASMIMANTQKQSK